MAGCGCKKRNNNQQNVGSSQVTIAPAEYMVVGVDLLSDETLRAWYSVDFDEIRIRSNFNFGATVATFGTTKYMAWNGKP